MASVISCSQVKFIASVFLESGSWSDRLEEIMQRRFTVGQHGAGKVVCLSFLCAFELARLEELVVS